MFVNEAPASNQWVFVTGMVRSGTTFVGKVLSLPYVVDYIHEPFNGGRSLPEGIPFEPRYIRPEATGAGIEAYRSHLAKIFRYQIELPTTWHPQDSLLRRIGKATIGSRGPVHLRMARMNPFHRAAILKDPTAPMVAEYLYREFGVQPVIVVRHPASLAASLERVGWWPEVEDVRQQTALLEDYFQDDSAFLRKRWDDPLLEAMARWRATYKVLLQQADEYDDWVVLKHEEASRRPIDTFKGLYETLGLPWSWAVRWRIQGMTGGDNSAEARGNQAMDLSRDSASIFALRRDSLEEERRREIFEVTREVALELYSRESFALG